MKNLMNKFALLGSLFVSLSFVAHSIMAQESEAKILSIINPTISSGIQVGDLLSRKVEFEVNLPYQISKTALPMKGERRNGLELAEIKVDSTQHDNRNIVTIALHYQVFASADRK